ncbi:MAG: DUF1499 domain-containing protein [Paracoccaceae bacterium]
MKLLLILVLLVVVVAMVGIRLAPSDPRAWHVVPEGDEDKSFKGGVIRVAKTGPDGLAKLDSVARATPRTTVLAGSVDEGHITYVTRSAVWGFPDYTTVKQDGDTLRLFARLRFGRSDLGVNGRRADQWLAAIQG